MANTYTAVPNVIPGNVTIGGNLTVSGDQIRIGAAAPFCRVGKRSALIAAISHNYDLISGANDVGQNNLYLDLVAAAGNPLSGRWHDGTGGQNFYGLGQFFAFSAVSVNVTGTVAETTVFTLNVRGGFFGANGGIRWWWSAFPAAQGGVATTLRVRIGATAVFSRPTTLVAGVHAEGRIMNQNAQNSQRASMWGNDSGVLLGPQDATAAIDTSAPFAITWTIQPGAVGDNWNSRQVSGDVKPGT